MADKDLYSILGVPRAADAEVIKKSYRKLARKHHPDVNPGSKEAEAKFKEISDAYDVLGDPTKRKLYDEFGSAGVQAGFNPDAARQYRRYQETRSGAETNSGFGGYSRFEDIFGDIFTGAGDGMQQPGMDVESELEIDLLDAIRGMATTVALQRPQTCSECNGRGADMRSGKECPDCGGRGQIRIKGPVAFSRTCPRCGGVGRIDVRACPKCGGAGQTMTTERLSVRIPPGVDTGSRVRVAGKGSAGSGGGESGDLYIRIKVRPHSLLERKGDDLYLEVPISVPEAISGGPITVPTPATSVQVQVPAGSQSGRLLRVRGHGVPHLKGDGKGDLYLRLMIHVPEPADDTVRTAASQLQPAYRDNLRDGLKL
jgi:molecular chaperone DnaJ